MCTGSVKTNLKIASMLLIAVASMLLFLRTARANVEAQSGAAAASALRLAVGGAQTDGSDAPPSAAPVSRETTNAPTRTADWSGVDADGDGMVTAADAALLARYESGWISMLPAAERAGEQPTLTTSLAAVERIIRGALNVDLSAYRERFSRGDLRRYSVYAGYADVFVDMADALQVTACNAVEQCMPALSRDFRNMSVPLHPTDASALRAPDWKTIAALFYAYGDELPAKLGESMQIAFSGAGGGGRALSVSFGTLEEIASLGDQTQQLHARFAFAYLNTAFDESGTPVLAKKHAYPDGYLTKVAHPLPGCLIKNCWFDPRDKGTRLHMGADIRADARTHIRSVTDGVVTYIGTLPVPGNYVVVLDPDGYEYHYYHMYEQSKLVKVGDVVRAGDPVGRVGSTGNSAANHLHLAIISPERVYLNPYDLFVQADIGPIKPDS